MRRLLLTLLLFQSILTFSQKENRFDVIFGASYPINLSEEDLARKLGFDLGFRYSRKFNFDGFIETGLDGVIYEMISWEKITRLDLYMPFLVGYAYRNIEFAGGGFFYYYLKLFNNTDYYSSYGLINQNNDYYDINSIIDIFGGINFNINYNINNNLLVSLDFKRFRLSSRDIFYGYSDPEYKYILVTLGLKCRL